MIEWIDASDRGSRFFQGEFKPGTQVNWADAIRAIFDFLQGRILGEGNAREFQVLMLEVNCDTGRLIGGAATEEGWRRNRTDGCSIRVQELQDFFYDLTDAGVTNDVLTESIKGRVTEIGRTFRGFLVESIDELRSKADPGGFRFMVFGSNAGESLLDDVFDWNS